VYVSSDISTLGNRTVRPKLRVVNVIASVGFRLLFVRRKSNTRVRVDKDGYGRLKIERCSRGWSTSARGREINKTKRRKRDCIDSCGLFRIPRVTDVFERARQGRESGA